MLEVANGKYSMTPKANADTKRSAATLVAVADRVLALLDWNSDLKKGLSTVSSYNISSGTWSGDLPKLDRPRDHASACVL